MHSGTSQHPRQRKVLALVLVLTGRQLPRQLRLEQTGRAPPQQQQQQRLQPLLHPPCSMLTPRTSQPDIEEPNWAKASRQQPLQACADRAYVCATKGKLVDVTEHMQSYTHSGSTAHKGNLNQSGSLDDGGLKSS